MILSVDPGVATGWAMWSHDKVTCTGESDFDAFTRLVDQQSTCLDIIVCERYTITAETLRKSRQPASLETIGFLRYVGLREDVPFVLQSPGDAKRFATDDRLRKAGWHHTGGAGHAHDALRHLMLYLVKNKLIGVPS